MTVQPRTLSCPVPATFAEVPGFAYYNALPVEAAPGLPVSSPAEEALDQLFGYYARG